MARKKQAATEILINKTELKCIIIRHFNDQKAFCKKYGINLGTLRHYINGRNMPKIDKVIKPIMAQLGYNPDGKPIKKGVKS